MKFKKIITILLVLSMISASFLGCGSKESSNEGKETKVTEGAKEVEATKAPDSGSTDVAPVTDKSERIVIDNFNVAANFTGLQTGWFQKIINDKFNIDLNIMSTQVAGGETLYQTKVAEGNLGDLLLLDAIQFADCVKAGLIKDITADLPKYPNLMSFKEQIDMLNQGLDAPYNASIYGMPTEMTNTSPVKVTADLIGDSPQLRWDLYNGIGAPEIKNLDGLLDVLETMMEKYPTTADGDKAYGMSLWPDWDNNDNMMGIANAVHLVTWYGEKPKGSVTLKPDGTFIPTTDKSTAYYDVMKFLYHANQRGIIHPDSGTQDWNAVCAQMSAGGVYLMWYNWSLGFWNSVERLSNGSAFIYIPVEDQKYYADADPYFGSGRVFCIGAGISDEKYARLMEFLDWYASPEGVTTQHNGIEGFNYEDKDGRRYVKNDNALMDNLPVPAEYGGGGYQDGNNAINQWLVSATSINPNTNEPYGTTNWSTYKEATDAQWKKDWRAKYGAEEPARVMEKEGKLLVSPNVSVALPSDPVDISMIREQCYKTHKEYSWKLIFAKDDAEFEAIWDEMTDIMYGYDYQKLVDFDIAKWQIELDKKNEIAASAAGK